jgi:hypothetical protein
LVCDDNDSMNTLVQCGNDDNAALLGTAW